MKDVVTYLVKWKGFDEKTWEPAENFSVGSVLLADYNAKHGIGVAASPVAARKGKSDAALASKASKDASPAKTAAKASPKSATAKASKARTVSPVKVEAADKKRAAPSGAKPSAASTKRPARSPAKKAHTDSANGVTVTAMVVRDEPVDEGDDDEWRHHFMLKRGADSGDALRVSRAHLLANEDTKTALLLFYEGHIKERE